MARLDNKVSSIPLKKLLKDDPRLAKAVIQRNYLTAENVADLHVLFLSSHVNVETFNSEESDYDPRIVTMAVLTTKPVSFETVGGGVALKSPQDTFVPEIGNNVALARAVRNYASL